MGFVNRKQNKVVVKKLSKSIKPVAFEGVVAGYHISDPSSVYNELYRYHD